MAIRLRQWRGETETGEKYSPRGRPWKTFPVEEQFFAVLGHARLRLGLKAEDVWDRTGLAPSTFSKMFATWVGFFCIEAASFASMAKKKGHRCDHFTVLCEVPVNTGDH